VPSNGTKGGTKPGDLMVKVDVAVPTSLTDEERQAIEALAEVIEPAGREHLGVAK